MKLEAPVNNQKPKKDLNDYIAAVAEDAVILEEIPNDPQATQEQTEQDQEEQQEESHAHIDDQIAALKKELEEIDKNQNPADFFKKKLEIANLEQALESENQNLDNLQEEFNALEKKEKEKEAKEEERKETLDFLEGRVQEAEQALKDDEEMHGETSSQRAVLQQELIDAKKELEKTKKRFSNADLEEILEKRLNNHKERLSQPGGQEFDRTRKQERLEQEYLDAKRDYMAGSGLKLSRKERRKRKEQKLDLEHFEKNFKASLGKEKSELYEQEKNKEVLKREAIEVLEGRVSRLKYEMFKDEIEDLNFWEKNKARLNYGVKRFKEWHAKPENKKELKKRALWSLGVTLGTGVATGGLSTVALAGGAAYGLGRFAASYVGGETARELYKARKKDYRKKLWEKRKNEHAHIYATQAKLTNLKEKESATGLSATEKSQKDALERMIGRHFKKKTLTDNTFGAETVIKQKKWTKRWDRIGRVLGGGLAASVDNFVDVDFAPSHTPEATASMPGAGTISEMEASPLPEDAPESAVAAPEKGVETEGFRKVEPETVIHEHYESGLSEDIETGEVSDVTETAERLLETGDNTINDVSIRKLPGGSARAGLTDATGMFHPDFKDLFAAPYPNGGGGLLANPETFRAAGLEMVKEKGGYVFRNVVNGEMLTQQEVYERIDFELVHRNLDKIEAGQVIDGDTSAFAAVDPTETAPLDPVVQETVGDAVPLGEMNSANTGAATSLGEVNSTTPSGAGIDNDAFPGAGETLSTENLDTNTATSLGEVESVETTGDATSLGEVESADAANAGVENNNFPGAGESLDLNETPADTVPAGEGVDSNTPTNNGGPENNNFPGAGETLDLNEVESTDVDKTPEDHVVITEQIEGQNNFPGAGQNLENAAGPETSSDSFITSSPVTENFPAAGETLDATDASTSNGAESLGSTNSELTTSPDLESVNSAGSRFEMFVGEPSPEAFAEGVQETLQSGDYLEVNLMDESGHEEGLSIIQMGDTYAIEGSTYAPTSLDKGLGDSLSKSREALLEFGIVPSEETISLMDADGYSNTYIPLTQNQAEFIINQYMNL